MGILGVLSDSEKISYRTDHEKYTKYGIGRIVL